MNQKVKTIVALAALLSAGIMLAAGFKANDQTNWPLVVVGAVVMTGACLVLERDRQQIIQRHVVQQQIMESRKDNVRSLAKHVAQAAEAALDVIESIEHDGRWIATNGIHKTTNKELAKNLGILVRKYQQERDAYMRDYPYDPV